MDIVSELQRDLCLHTHDGHCSIHVEMRYNGDFIKCKHLLHYWSSVRKIHQSQPVYSFSQNVNNAAIWCFFDVCLNKVLNKQQWSQTAWLSCGLGSLQWRHNERDGVSSHRRLHCLLNCGFRRISKKTSTLHATGLCAENLPVTGEFPAQKGNNVENFSIW